MSVKPMKPRELRQTIEKLGLSQNGTAIFLDLSDGRTVRRWLEDADSEGHRDVPGPVAKFLRYMVAAGITPAQVDDTLKRNG